MQNKAKDVLDKKYSTKQFLMELYRPLITKGNNLTSGHYICISKNNNDITMFDRHFKNIDEIIDYSFSNLFRYNCYFNLSTTNGNSRTTNDLQTRTCIGLDFDQQLTVSDIVNMFSSIKLHYHAIINSGHGVHVYIFIEATDNLELVEEVTKTLANKLGADCKATLKTQLLRIPNTHNVKDIEHIRTVTLVHLEDKDTIIRPTIENLASRYLHKEAKDTNIKYVLRENIPKCLDGILTNGSNVGNRNEDLKKIVVLLKKRNKTLANIKHIALEWNEKNDCKMNENELEYQIEYMYNNLASCNINCSNCEHFNSCYNAVGEWFNTDGILIPTTEKTIKKCKKTNKKGVGVMNGNMLVVYAILKVYYEGITQSEILEQLSKNENEKPCISKPTLIKCLKELERMEIVEIVEENNKKLYKINSKVDSMKHEEYKFSINFACADKVIQGQINSEDLRLYAFMRYLHNMELRNGAKRSNVFNIRQLELSRLYGEDQATISRRIKKLEKFGMLGIVYRQSSRSNKDYYIYKLKY